MIRAALALALAAAAWTGEAVAEAGGTAALGRATAWLARTQTADGAWPGRQGATSGVVAAGALALMAAGEVPDAGRGGRHAAAAVRFLLAAAQPDGLIWRTDFGPAPMYHHGLATLALAEAWGMAPEPRLREVLERAVAVILGSQNARGGWRYQPVPGDDDLSVTVMQLMALRAVREAGLAVPQATIDRAVAYVRSCHNGRSAGGDGGFAYQPGGGSGFARSGAGLAALLLSGAGGTEVAEAVAYLEGWRPLGAQAVDKPEWYHYGLYYAALGLHRASGLDEAGRLAWRRWHPAAVRDLVARQQEDGSWPGEWPAYDTAMGALVLAIPLGLLPAFAR